jgi:hypothetical protein
VSFGILLFGISSCRCDFQCVRILSCHLIKVNMGLRNRDVATFGAVVVPVAVALGLGAHNRYVRLSGQPNTVAADVDMEDAGDLEFLKAFETGLKDTGLEDTGPEDTDLEAWDRAVLGSQQNNVKQLVGEILEEGVKAGTVTAQMVLNRGALWDERPTEVQMMSMFAEKYEITQRTFAEPSLAEPERAVKWSTSVQAHPTCLQMKVHVQNDELKTVNSGDVTFCVDEEMGMTIYHSPFLDKDEDQ